MMITKRRNGLFNRPIRYNEGLRELYQHGACITINGVVVNRVREVKLGCDGYVVFIGEDPKESSLLKGEVEAFILYGCVKMMVPNDTNS